MEVRREEGEKGSERKGRKREERGIKREKREKGEREEGRKRERV